MNCADKSRALSVKILNAGEEAVLVKVKAIMLCSDAAKARINLFGAGTSKATKVTNHTFTTDQYMFMTFRRIWKHIDRIE